VHHESEFAQTSRLKSSGLHRILLAATCRAAQPKPGCEEAGFPPMSLVRKAAGNMLLL